MCLQYGSVDGGGPTASHNVRFLENPRCTPVDRSKDCITDRPSTTLHISTPLQDKMGEEKKVQRDREITPRELKQNEVPFHFRFFVPCNHSSSGRGGGASGCGAKITSSGGEVWLSSPSKVAMMLRPANERPASAFMPATAPKESTNLT
jgi:hypothetical protein